MRRVAAFLATAIVLTGCGGDSSSGELEAAQQQIAELEAELAQAEEPAETTTSSAATTTAPTTTTQRATEDLEELLIAFRVLFDSETYPWTDSEIASAADEVCRQGRNGDWDSASDASAMMDDWYWNTTFFVDVYDMTVVQVAIGALTAVGGCDDLWTQIIKGWE